jgi:acetate kinase
MLPLHQPNVISSLVIVVTGIPCRNSKELVLDSVYHQSSNHIAERIAVYLKVVSDIH